LERDILLATHKRVEPGGYRWRVKANQQFRECKLTAVDADLNRYSIIVLQSTQLPGRFCITLVLDRWNDLSEPVSLLSVNTSNTRHTDNWRKSKVQGPHFHFYDEQAVSAGFSEREPADAIVEPLTTLETGVSFFCRKTNVEPFMELIGDGTF
jgi:hypothetical protein